MRFSKTDMQEQLLAFLSAYGEEITSLIGANGPPEPEAIRASALWNAVSDMYDYGTAGVPNGELGPGNAVDGTYARAEAFFRTLDTPAMKVYLDTCGAPFPAMALRTVHGAIARIVLDGGRRHRDHAMDVYGLGKGDGDDLTLPEIALLANMDERSVRNAANPRLADPLKTRQVGNRSLVTVEEARRWLAGRKGFVPTMSGMEYVQRPPVDFNISVPQEFHDLVQRMAEETGAPISVIAMELFLKASEAAMGDAKKS
ncbi:hypothetical protein [Massilia sp. CFBP9026]|uniref:hypothetical protein n=1 Tax=Massilia sp. CFBP9026 TaxID=3096536 RepID=UPI002A6AD6F3|nr:hypothetical protein [Massilia sp. CFBP9026]MDY0961596.1 hypothetical protein [Massilia sp. CFBP9026]